MIAAVMTTALAGTVKAEKITNYNDIVSGTKYYIGATTGETDYYLSVDGTTASSTSKAGTAVTSKASATVFTFRGSSNTWTIQFESGNYLSLKTSKDNGKVLVVSSPSTFVTTNQTGKFRLTLESANFSIQKNNSGTQFGSYQNTQTDIWLEPASSTLTYDVTYDANGGTGTMTDSNSPYEENDEVTLLTNTFTAPEGKIWDSWEVKDASNNDITVTNGKFTMPASNVTVKAQWVDNPSAPQYNWVETSLSDLTSNDIFVIVGDNGDTYALSSANGASSAPPATAVTVEDGKITSEVADNLKWNISGDATNGYTFYPNGSTTTFIYCTNANNGVRVGKPNSNTTEIHAFTVSGGYLKAGFSTARYIGIYNSTDWRCYTSTTGNSNIANQTFAFYKRVDANATIPPSISANDVDITFNATSGSIAYTINNPVSGTLTASVPTGSWITLGSDSGSLIAFTCAANTETIARTATVTLTYTYNTNETVTKVVTITQAAAPVSYTTIPAIFADATSTATDVYVNFGGWVVSGVNGSNAYLTDNQGNGLIIYASEHGFQVGDVLTGIVSCKLQLYRGSAELTNLTSSTEGLSVAHNGTVTEANIAMADLAGVNTGALVSYENLTCSVTTSGNYTNYDLTDGTTTIRAYTTLYDFTSTSGLEDGKTYNIKGIFLQYTTNSANTKEILPRSAADIVEVEVQHEQYTLTVSSLSNVEMFVFDAADTNELLLEGEGIVQIYDGTEVLISVAAVEGYDILKGLLDD